jgi:preprotein translocase subunit SecG
MLTFFIYLLTALLVIDCVFLVLLVLVQLPKKEAGMGQAFGGAATDALFGAGSGNVLTKATKWGAAIFFVLAITLTIMGTYKTTGSAGRLQRIMSEKPATPATQTTPAPGANTAPGNPGAATPNAAPTLNIPNPGAPAGTPAPGTTPAPTPAPAATPGK